MRCLFQRLGAGPRGRADNRAECGLGPATSPPQRATLDETKGTPSMTDQPATRHLQFWIAAIVITAINLGVWMVPRPGGSSSDGFGGGSHLGPPPLRIEWSSGSSLIERAGRLELGLDQDVFTTEQIGHPLDRSPFTIDPAISGIWEVSSVDAVTFVPDATLPAGNLLRIGTDRSHPFFRSWSFDETSLPVVRYRPLIVEQATLGDLQVPSDQPGTRTATLQIEFNQPVRRSVLMKHLTLEVDGVVVTPAAHDDTATAEHQLIIDVKPGSQVTLALDGDLHGQEGMLGLGETFRRAFGVSPSLDVRWVDADIDWYDRSGAERSITLAFDRRLAEGQTPIIDIQPDPGGVTTRVRGDRITLRGPFQEGHAYQVTVDPPLMGADRSLLDRRLVRAVRMPTARPDLSFEVREGQVVPGGRFEVALRHAVYTKARLVVHRLVDEHLPMILGEFISDHRIPTAGEVVCDRVIELPRHDGGRGTTMIRLDDHIERRPGVYHVRIEDTGDDWERDTIILVVSDLAIDLEVGSRSMTAWVTSVTTGEPVEGVEVVAWAPNITSIDAHTTGADGIARLPLRSDEVHVITATRGDDVLFVRPRRAKAIEDRELAGPTWPAATDAAFYAERGVHRPGETLHLTAVVRTRDGQPVTDTPYEIRWIRPDSRVERTIEAMTDPIQGVLHVDVPTDELDPTGRWTAALHLPGADTPVTTLECPVMPFLPVRLRVAATVEPAEDGATAIVGSTTEYLHGAPAGGLAGTVTTRWTPAPFQHPRFEGFTFEPRRSFEITRGTRDVRTDELGATSTEITPPTEPAVWNLSATVSITEPGGRATSATVETRLDTQRTHVGIRLPEGRIHMPGDEISAEAVILTDGVVDSAEPPIVEIVRVDRDWTYERVDGRWMWNSMEHVEPTIARVTFDPPTADGVQPFNIPSLSDGEYRLIATLPDTTIAATLDFHVSRWRTEGRMAATRSDRLELIPDRETARPGEVMTVLVRSPFPGTALVSVETDDIVTSKVIEVAGAGSNVNVEIPMDARDTAFVSAILVRPLDSDRRDWAPLVARGAARIGIDRRPHRLQPTITASTDARPGETVATSIVVPGASASSVVHLWAVEEGALLPTDYHAPDPADALLRDRRRMVNAISSIVDLIPEFDRAIADDAIGGDAARRRREPIPVRLPETRVIWRQAEVLGDDGRIEVDLTMPEIDGAMRLMAVAIDGDRYGAAEHVIGVVPAVQIVAALPRTMSPGDLVRMPVTLRNNTAATNEVEFTVDPSDRLKVELDTTVVVLEPGASTMVQVDLRPVRIGEAPITLRAVVQDTTGTIETVMPWRIAVRPPFGFQRDTQRLIADGGTTRLIDRDRRLDALGGTIDVTVSAVPDVDLGPAVQELIDYPYGCGEQIGSRVEGLLAALTVAPSVSMTDVASIRTMAASGIARLWEMQTRDGRIPYWPGGRGDDWLTARTAMLAVRALDRGVAMPSSFHDGLMRAAARIVADGRIDRGTRILALRAIAESGLAEPAAIETMFLERNDLSLGDRAHLAAALNAISRDVEAMAVVDGFTVPVAMPPTDDGAFASDVTEAATALSVGLQVHAESASLTALRDLVTRRQGERRWRTTYETAASVEALTAWSRAHPSTGEAAGTVVVAGRTVTFDGDEPVHVRFDSDSGIASSAVDRIESTGDGPLHVVVTTSGVPVESGPSDARRQGLEIVRRWLDATGAPIDPSTPIAAGRTVIVEVSYRSTIGADLPNVAIVDVLPSGFEIELPTLLTSAATDAQLDAVDHVEFRDDRVLVFDTAVERPQRFRYVARAVVPGDWIRPGTVAESMYHDAVRASLPLDRVTISLDRRR